MSQFRWHRGSLAQSMITIEHFDGMEGLLEIIKKDRIFKALVNASEEEFTLKVEKYIHDMRIGWDTHIVLLNGTPIGFTDGAIE